MPERYHSQLTTTHGIHAPHAYSYANAAARTGDTGRNANDLTKFAIQTDNNSVWMLTAITPTWLNIPAVTPVAGAMMYSTAAKIDLTTIADLQWDNTNKRLGVALAAASFEATRLEVVGSTNPAIYFTDNKIVAPPSDPLVYVKTVITKTSGEGVGLWAAAHGNAASGTLTVIGIRNDAHNDAAGIASLLIGAGATIENNNTASPVTDAYAFRALFYPSASATITNAIAYGIRPLAPPGTLTHFYAFHFPDIAFSSDQWFLYNLRADAKSYLEASLLLGVTAIGSASGRLVLKTGTTEADGISFGTGADRATLYRSAADTLKTDDTFIASIFQSTVVQSGAASDLLLKYNTTTVLTISSATVTCAQDVDLATGKVYKVNTTQVVGARVTGYTAFSGSAVNRATSYDTATITLPQLAERVNALQTDLTTHGIIGA